MLPKTGDGVAKTAPGEVYIVIFASGGLSFNSPRFPVTLYHTECCMAYWDNDSLAAAASACACAASRRQTSRAARS